MKAIVGINPVYRRLRQLEKEVGRKVSETEVETWVIQRMWRDTGMSDKEIKSATERYLA